MPRSKRSTPAKAKAAAISAEPLTHVTITGLREHGGKVFHEVAVERRRIILTDRGREIGAIIPMHDFRLLPPDGDAR